LNERKTVPPLFQSSEERSRFVSKDDLSRDVYGMLGMPIDLLDRSSVLKRMLAAIEGRQRLLLSTPNVNFMMESNRDAEFRESLLSSDLCCVDGMPIVWLARLVGIPVTERVSGSDLFDIVRSSCDPSRPIRVFLFGGGEGVAQRVCHLINARPSGMHCVGWLSPGFGTIAEMSTPEIMQTINGSKADLLAVFLSAKKGQYWLGLNRQRLNIPVCAQLGATINYQAGIVRRAPLILRHLGLEWLWRIKEEPYLWRRYWNDGLSLCRFVITRALPIAIGQKWHRCIQKSNCEELSFSQHEQCGSIVVSLMGYATKERVGKSIAVFRDLLAQNLDIIVDVSQTRSIDPRFFGLLLMVRMQLKKSGKSLQFTGVTTTTKRVFRRNGFEFLLEPNRAVQTQVVS
jgi:N-acetylglucosaminyldiphosphoundecaprenol N-acetyl-beta-D-mannosaminyltransferase